MSTSPLKPFQRIASKYQISEESAKYFLGRIQKSFKKERPPHALILDFMQTQTFEFLPAPYDVALLMQEAGLWDFALHAPPPMLVDGSEEEVTTSELEEE